MIEPLLQAERLLMVGLLDQAEGIYARVTEQDPRNTIAVMGLARVALARGDEESALGHARRALRIDPQNPAARAIETRLSELLGRDASSAGVPQSERRGFLRRVLGR